MANVDDGTVLRGINWREAFPFTNIFRSFRIAMHPSKMFLALCALLAIYLGGRILDAVWPAAHRAETGWMNYVGSGQIDLNAKHGIFIAFFSHQIGCIDKVVAGVVANNWLGAGGVVEGIQMFLGAPWILFNDHPIFGLIFTTWFLLVWSIFGGAIARIAAVHVARDERMSVRASLKFSSGKVLSYLFAPLIPLVIIFVIGILLSIGGLLMYIPFLGPILVGLLTVLALAAGFVMTLLLVGTVGGLNLMYPTIAAEGSDSFDAISRSFSYVYARPWRMLFYTCVAIVYGALTFLFVRLFVFLMLLLANFFTSWWLGGETGTAWAAFWPPATSVMDLSYSLNTETLGAGQRVGAWIVAFWVYLTIGLLGAYGISYFFSANTIVYFLMRKEVDATEMDDVFLEQSEEEFSEAAPAAAPPTVSQTAATVVTSITETNSPPPPENPPSNDSSA